MNCDYKDCINKGTKCSLCISLFVNKLPYKQDYPLYKIHRERLTARNKDGSAYFIDGFFCKEQEIANVLAKYEDNDLK